MSQFEKIERFISYNKTIKDEKGQQLTISVSIPEMDDDDLIKEVKTMCTIMNKAQSIMEGKGAKINKALSATMGTRRNVTPADAERSFEKCFGILVKLNNEIVLRGLSKDVTQAVQDALGRKTRVESTLTDDDQLLLT